MNQKQKRTKVQQARMAQKVARTIKKLKSFDGDLTKLNSGDLKRLINNPLKFSGYPEAIRLATNALLERSLKLEKEH